MASMGRMKKDWIEQVNDLADKLKHDDRFVLEYMIMFVAQKKLGDDFLKFYAAKTVEDNG